jgi:hypothetical protein
VAKLDWSSELENVGSQSDEFERQGFEVGEVFSVLHLNLDSCAQLQCVVDVMTFFNSLIVIHLPSVPRALND